jgi:hypothetical protein
MKRNKAILILDEIIKESLYLMETLSEENRHIIQETYMLQPKFHRNPEVLENLIRYVAESIYGEDTMVDPEDGVTQDTGISKVDELINNLNDKTEKIHKILNQVDDDKNYQKTMALLYTISKAKDYNLAKDEAWKNALLSKYNNLSLDQKKELKEIIDSILIDCNLKEDESTNSNDIPLVNNNSDEVDYNETPNDLELKLQNFDDADITQDDVEIDYDEDALALESKLSGKSKK